MQAYNDELERLNGMYEKKMSDFRARHKDDMNSEAAAQDLANIRS